jgi:hypothetical protein
LPTVPIESTNGATAATHPVFFDVKGEEAFYLDASTIKANGEEDDKHVYDNLHANNNAHEGKEGYDQ